MSAQLQITHQSGKKIYFASDIHLGEPDYQSSREREARFLRWLANIERDAQALFLVGDIFDFWFEYKKVVPLGYTRFLGRIAQLTDAGLPVYVFPGNHDIWMKDYLEKESGVQIFRDKLVLDCGGKRIFVAHGDGLGPGDLKFKLLKKVFTNPFCQWLFRWLHPDIGIKIARLWSGNSRLGHQLDKKISTDKEWLVQYARRKLEKEHFDYFVFGHRHLPKEYNISETTKYINLGDWINSNTYGEFDGETLRLQTYKDI